MILSAILILSSQIGNASGVKPKFPVPSSMNDSQNGYKKYTHYPKYCSTPDEMETRAVPPLGGTSNDGSSKLIHVTAIIRHGARTPFRGAPGYKCWDGFWDDEETGVWNCNLKTYVSPPAATNEKGQVVDSQGMLVEEEPDFMFEKRYDALTIPPGDKTLNNLNGTCQLGQLIMRGYDQELRNGLHLRQAYFYDGNNTSDEHAASDSRMRLWDLTSNDDGRQTSSTTVIGDASKPIYEEPNLRYRADDEQRTLMSGQVLLRGLFEQELLAVGDDETAIIPLHTADFHLDVLGINEHVCPRTIDVRDEAYKSDEYKEWVNSVEVKAVKAFVQEQLGMEEMPYSMLDCLMTTICTDRTLPEPLNDYDGSLGPTSENEALAQNENMFERIANFATQNYTFAYKYNDAAWAKLGMGPLWKEIMTNILPIVGSSNNAAASSDTHVTPPKLALFSGHDTTLMPILSTLGEDVWSGNEWAPYASMIQIEIHESAEFSSGFAFRLIYNGEVLTSKMDGCTAELCDSQVLVKQVEPFAYNLERDCASDASVPSQDDMMGDMKTATKNMAAERGGIFVMVLLVGLGLALGSVMMWLIMRRQMKKHGDYRMDTVAGDLSMSAMEEDHQEEINSAIPYSAPHGNEKKFNDDDENNLI